MSDSAAEELEAYLSPDGVPNVLLAINGCRYLTVGAP